VHPEVPDARSGETPRPQRFLTFDPGYFCPMAKSDSSTIPSLDSGMDRWEISMRVVSLILIGGLVLAGATGLLGVRTAEATGTGGGYTLTVWYAETSRPGLATPFSLEVRSDTGDLPAEVTLRVSSSYLALFDDNGMEPDPVESYNTPEWTWWTFEIPPASDVLRVDLDARLEPAVQSAETATAAVEIDGLQVVSVNFTTWVAP
jgi:hypothetical protein